MLPIGKKIIWLSCLLVWMISCSPIPALLSISFLFLSRRCPAGLEALEALGADSGPGPRGYQSNLGSTHFGYLFHSTVSWTHPLLPFSVESKAHCISRVTPTLDPKSNFLDAVELKTRGPSTPVTWALFSCFSICDPPTFTPDTQKILLSPLRKYSTDVFSSS